MLKANSLRITCALMFMLLNLGSPLAYACDESCKRAQAEERLKIKYPSYLNKRYCRDVSGQFLTTAAKSLQRYRENQLSDLHRGGMYNTRKFLVQRKEWLKECDDYLQQVSRYRVFRNDKTTKDIFSAIDKVNTILAALVNGATYVSDEGYDSLTAVSERFDNLLKLMDNHKTQMQLAGQLNID
ncbi:hypothetical protein [uncultured Pseudoteredinibacter sp.]|uniref:hypothetical protein n=1 Tax=uncultured Pseudoteredinibacter sp. TaxID=1641701 RepID=UPI002625CB29|nr:hypothetical protein [uncultured Pseudoteredinibacter sp.]